MGFMVYQMDVKSAFLYRTIEEEVYVYQPPIFEDPDYPDKVYKVVKALYGLHQASRAWYETLANYLLENGFQRRKIDQTLFIKKQKVKQKPDGIFISQDKYVAEILRKFGLTDRKSANTPIDTEKPLLKDPDGDDVDVHTYRSIIGSLMYLTSSRPDIMFAVYRTSWNKFSSSMALAVICLSTGRKFNFSKYIFDSLVRNMDSSTKFYMYPRFLQLMIKAQVDDLSSHTIKYSSPALTQKVFTNIRRVGNGFSGVETPLFEGMIVAQQADDVADEGAAGVDVDDGEIIANIDADVDVILKDIAAVEKTVEIEKDADDDELEPAELKEVVKVVTTAKLMTEVVTAAAAATITAATTLITVATLTVAPSVARRRKGVVIRDPEETSTPSIIIHFEPKSKYKGKGIMVEEPKPLKKQAQIEQDEAYAKALEAGLNKNINWDDVIEQVQRKEKEDNAMLRMSYDDIHLIFKKYFNLNVAFLEKTKEQLEEEESRELKRKTKSSEEKAVKKQKLDEEVEELKKHLQIMPNNDDDVYTEATPLALKVPVVDYEIYTENNKPYFKIIRADGTHQLFLSFLSLLRNFDREDLDVLWQIVKERFASSKPKNFLDDFLLTTLTYMFEKPDVEAQV
nr:hypothetical protein [Tanacetum cinerariifolium]